MVLSPPQGTRRGRSLNQVQVRPWGVTLPLVMFQGFGSRNSSFIADFVWLLAVLLLLPFHWRCSTSLQTIHLT